MSLVAGCLIACGSETGDRDGGVLTDGSIDVTQDAALDATTDARDSGAGVDSSDADVADSGDADVLADAGCSKLSPGACTLCCIAEAGGTGSFDVHYGGACLMCASCGPNVRPCGASSIYPPASGGCIQCLRPSLMQGQAWAACQLDSTCSAFVKCFAMCPMN